MFAVCPAIQIWFFQVEVKSFLYMDVFGISTIAALVASNPSPGNTIGYQSSPETLRVINRHMQR